MAGRTSYYGGIVLDGLVFHIDAAKQESYAKRGLRYMQAGNNNLFIDFADVSKSPSTQNATGTIINGATFSNFCPYHLSGFNFYKDFYHDYSTSSWRESAGVGTFYGNIEFDGLNDYISFANTPEMNGITDITVSTWVYINKFNSGSNVIVSRRDSGNNNGWELSYDNMGRVFFTVIENNTTWIDVESSYTIKASNSAGLTANGGWYNIVGTKSGNVCKIYVASSNKQKNVNNPSIISKSVGNNFLRGTTTAGVGNIPFSSNVLHLGKSSTGETSYMDGRIMQLSVYNRALSPEEIDINHESFSKRIFQIDGIPTEACPGRRLVFQICNSNAYADDNFDIYLNGTYIGAANLSQDALVGSVFIADLNPAVTVLAGDFACPMNLMVTYRFDPGLLLENNVLEMRNTYNNMSGNYGSIGVRNYGLSGNSLSNPCFITNLFYNGNDGDSFTLNFSYQQCCA